MYDGFLLVADEPIFYALIADGVIWSKAGELTSAMSGQTHPRTDPVAHDPRWSPQRDSNLLICAV